MPEEGSSKSADDKRKRAKLLHKLMSATTIIRRNSEDGKTCFPGEVTAQNVSRDASAPLRSHGRIRLVQAFNKEVITWPHYQKLNLQSLAQ